MLERGSLTVARVRGIPIRLHWTLPLGALLFSGFRFAPGFWLGFLLLVLIHELGHAALVRWFRLRVVGIDISGFGGLCHWSGYATAQQRGAIAWGGVLAQALLLLGTLGVLLVLGRPTTAFAAELTSVFTFTNVYLIALNLLPIPPLDGHEAWRFLVRWLRGGGPKSPAGFRPPARSPGNGAQHGGSQQAKVDLARMLEKVGEEARKARR